ncbi:hypothetical protein FHG87_021588 [Trinorchestia longiramus]|nr:hypothetical protein FHG87_021588 [Trinorchestia longiramus]
MYCKSGGKRKTSVVALLVASGNLVFSQSLALGKVGCVNPITLIIFPAASFVCSASKLRTATVFTNVLRRLRLVCRLHTQQSAPEVTTSVTDERRESEISTMLT